MAHTGQINHDTSAPKIMWIILSILIVMISLGIIYWASVYFYIAFTSEELNNKQSQARPSRDYRVLRAYEATTLSQLKWVDKNTVHVPINVAMKLVINDYQSK